MWFLGTQFSKQQLDLRALAQLEPGPGLHGMPQTMKSIALLVFDGLPSSLSGMVSEAVHISASP